MTQAEEIVPARTLGGEKTESLGGTGKTSGTAMAQRAMERNEVAKEPGSS